MGYYKYRIKMTILNQIINLKWFNYLNLVKLMLLESCYVVKHDLKKWLTYIDGYMII